MQRQGAFLSSFGVLPCAALTPCPQKYNRYLRDLIISGRAKPSFVVSHNVSLDEAADAYTKFDKRIDGYTKVLLHP